MAGRFEGLSDIEWKLFEDIFPQQPEKRGKGNGLPVANCTTPANGNEREQLIPLIDATNLKTHKRGRPSK